MYFKFTLIRAAPMDYIQFSITLTLPANTPNNTLSCTVISIQDDDEMEEKEYFSLRIDNQTPDVVTVLEGNEELIVYIVDDDCESLPPPLPLSLPLSLSLPLPLPPSPSPSLSLPPSLPLPPSPSFSLPPSLFPSLTLPRPSLPPSPSLPHSPSYLPYSHFLPPFYLPKSSISPSHPPSLTHSPMISTVSPSLTHTHTISSAPVAVVGFQVTESLVNESIANKFTCLEIFSGGPLLFDSDVMFYTQDGTAVGKINTSIVTL